MSTSEMQRFIRVSGTAYDGDEAVDAGLYHDVLDSLAHLCDELGQVRVNWPYSRGSGTVALTTQTAASTSVWYPIAVLAVFPISVKPDLTPFLLRCRMTGYASANNNVTFRLCVAPAGTSAMYATIATAPANVMETSATASLTPIDLTTAANTIALTKEIMLGARQTISTYDAVSGASPVAVDVAMIEISAWGKTSNVAAVPTLVGCYAAEYVGT